MKPLILLSVALLFLTAPAHAKGGGSDGSGSTQPNPGIPQQRRIERDIGGSQLVPGREVPSGIEIEGAVRNAAGLPLGDVLVKLFANGIVTTSARTEADGSFTLQANPQVGGNNTIVLWFQSPDPERVLDAHAVISAGKVARERNLFPGCVQRVQISGNTARVEVQLMTSDERKTALERSRCLERET